MRKWNIHAYISDTTTMTDVGMAIQDAGIGDSMEDIAVIANRLTASSDLIVSFAYYRFYIIILLVVT